MVFESNLPKLEIDDKATLGEYVLNAASKFGDKPALIDGTTGRTVTYSQFVGMTKKVSPHEMSLISRK